MRGSWTEAAGVEVRRARDIYYMEVYILYIRASGLYNII